MSHPHRAAILVAAAITLTVGGDPSARLAGTCVLDDGTRLDLDLSPPAERSFPSRGLRCELRHVAGRGPVEITARRDGSVSRVTTGPGGSASLTIR